MAIKYNDNILDMSFKFMTWSPYDINPYEFSLIRRNVITSWIFDM